MLVGPGATGPGGQPMPGVLVGVDPCRQRSRCQAMCWAGRLAAFIAEALSGSGSPAPRRWGACSLGFPLPPRGMSRSTNRPVEGLVRWGFPPRACGEAGGVVSSGRFLTPRGW